MERIDFLKLGAFCIKRMSLKAQEEMLFLAENGLSFTDSVLNELHEIESGRDFVDACGGTLDLSAFMDILTFCDQPTIDRIIKTDGQKSAFLRSKEINGHFIIENAARCIVLGASMDNNIICVDEKEVLVVEAVADQLMAAFSHNKAIILTPFQIQQLENLIFAKNNGPRKAAEIEKSLIGKDIQLILSKIGLKVDNQIRLAIAPVEQDHPLVWSEQMLPILPVVKMPNADAAIDIAKEAEHGFGHSAIMHSRNIDNLSRMARVMNCSIFVKNGPSLAGLGYGGEGYCSFSIASPTGEGITNPKSFSRERRCVLVDHFRIV